MGNQLSSNHSIDVVVPCFQEELSLPNFFNAYTNLVQSLPSYRFNLIIVDNGSTDKTLEVVQEFLTKENNRGICLELSRNFGKEASLTAGLAQSKSDLVIPIDADLQDPMEIVPQLIDAWENSGADVILGRRISRQDDSFSRRFLSRLFGHFFSKLSDVELVQNTGEFRLMTRNVVEAFNLMPEKQRFVRGMLAWLGFKIVIVDYIRPARKNGKSSFNLFRLFELGIQGITAFSIKPLRIATFLGLFISTSSALYALFIFGLAVRHQTLVPGFASLQITILFIGGVQMLFLGILGEYLGRVLLETKDRPLYIIRKVHK
jgi:glycosyltransferase involved in cell wall biosynthesis